MNTRDKEIVIRVIENLERMKNMFVQQNRDALEWDCYREAVDALKDAKTLDLS